MEMTGAVTVRRYIMNGDGDRTLTVTFTVGQCAFAPRTSTENNDRATAVDTDAELYVPPWAGIKPSDIVQLADGTTWEVVGQPEVWQHPWGQWRPGNVVALNRHTG